jgi:nucleoside-diphosphate-sugar epimerase
MRIFVTGASGHIGSAVVPELLAGGHTVVGLARSDASAAALAAAGAEVQRGDLDDLDTLRQAAAATDGVVHIAFKAFTSDMTDAAAADLTFIQTIGSALAGTGKPFVTTGVTLMLWMGGITGRPGTEEDVVEGGFRVDSENATVALAERGVRSSVVRLPPVVHSTLDKAGLTPKLIRIAREKGVAGYVGDGANRWPAVHTWDVARLYRLALESAPAGSRLHAVADDGVPLREIAEAIGHNLGVPTASIAPQDAAEHFGSLRFLSPFVSADIPASNALTRKWAGWEPTHPGLIADLNDGHYFDQAAA